MFYVILFKPLNHFFVFQLYELMDIDYNFNLSSHVKQLCVLQDTYFACVGMSYNKKGVDNCSNSR